MLVRMHLTLGPLLATPWSETFSFQRDGGLVGECLSWYTCLPLDMFTFLAEYGRIFLFLPLTAFNEKTLFQVNNAMRLLLDARKNNKTHLDTGISLFPAWHFPAILAR